MDTIGEKTKTTYLKLDTPVNDNASRELI